MSKLQTYTDANWDAEVMNSPQPVLVDLQQAGHDHGRLAPSQELVARLAPDTTSPEPFARSLRRDRLVALEVGGLPGTLVEIAPAERT